MRYHYSSLLFLICFVFFTECTDKPTKEKKDVELVQINTQNNKEVLLKDFVSLNFIKLETSEEVLLARPSKILSVKNNLIVLDRKLKSIFRFDSVGNFLNRIGQIGSGPGEFKRPMDILWDESDQHIKVLANTHSGYFEYDLEGKYYGMQKNEFFTVGFAQIGGLMAWYNGYNGDKHNLILTDKEGQVLDQYFNYDQSEYPFSFAYSGNISDINRGGFLYAETAEPILYEFDLNAEIKRKFIFDFGPKTWPVERKTDVYDFAQKAQMGEINYLGSQFYGNNWGLSFDYFGNNHFYGFYRYNDGKVFTKQSLKEDPLSEIIWAPCGSYNNVFFSFIIPSGFYSKSGEFKNRIRLEYPKLYEMLMDSPSEYDNPIIVIMKTL